MKLFDRTWRVIETAAYEDKTTTLVREQGLSRRQAERRAAEWQSASNRNKAMIRLLVAPEKRKPLPTVTYSAEPPTGEAEPWTGK